MHAIKLVEVIPHCPRYTANGLDSLDLIYDYEGKPSGIELKNIIVTGQPNAICVTTYNLWSNGCILD